MEQKQKTQKDIIPGYSTIDDFTKNGFKILVEATKASNALPTERNWDFYKVHDSFNTIMNCEGDRVLRLTNSILHMQHVSSNIRNRDVEEKMEIVIEANDDILEKVAIGIDEMNGIKRTLQEAVEMQAVSAQLPINGSWNQLNKATYSVSSSIDTVVNEKSRSLKSIRLLTAKNIVRPQSFFKDKIDNRNTSWIPRITEKPNSIKPLAIFLEESDRGEEYSHPYEFELERFTPSVEQLQKVNPLTPKPLVETPLYEITTPEQLNDLLEELRKHSEFAVDLEHHSYRTFMGITCLLQISTKDADYLIDTLTLRDKLCILNEVFTKPSIVKVFHGADSDIEWLQRDLSVYVVNMFDTHQAAKQLEYSGLSLAYLLNKFCSIVPNKHFQLADWRIRPLPDELKTYARMDTHYLLHIHHMLRNELLKKGNGSDNILTSVIQQSTRVCKKRYLKPLLRDESHLDFYRKCKRMFDNKQMFALKELYSWRDNIARTEDESTGYVLPNHMLLQISEVLPREMQGILACCNPIPPLVRANLLELHRIILRAREQSLIKPILKEDNRSRGSTKLFTKVNVDSPLHCPHDLSKMPEFRDDLPTLLGDMLENAKNGKEKSLAQTGSISKILKSKSMYSVFNTPESSEDENENETVSKVRNLTFLGPYERYKLVKPFIQAEEDKAAAEKAKNPEKEPEQQTNDDRIAALHAHFVKVAKETPQKVPSDAKPTEDETPEKASSSETLVSMGGSKKRKRNRFEPEDASELHPDYKIPQNELHTPVPNWKRNKPSSKKRSRRNNNANQASQAGHKQFPPNYSHNKNSNQPPQAGYQQSPRNYNPQEQQGDLNYPEMQNTDNRNYKPPTSKKRANKNTNQPPQAGYRQSPRNYNQQEQQSDSNIPEMQNTDNRNYKSPTSKKQMKRKEWFLRQKLAKNMEGTPLPSNSQTKSNDFTPFDYSSVNFQQFQGGAGGANKKQGVKTQFKAKNKNKKFNKNSNKTITYDRRQQ